MIFVEGTIIGLQRDEAEGVEYGKLRNV